MRPILINAGLTLYQWALNAATFVISFFFTMTKGIVSTGNYFRRIFRDKVVECLSSLVNGGWIVTLYKNPSFFYSSNYMEKASPHTLLLLGGSLTALFVQLLSIILTRQDDSDENASEPDDSPKRMANKPWIWAIRALGFGISAVVSTYATVMINWTLMHSEAKAPSPYLPLMAAIVVGSWVHLVVITWSFAQSRRKLRESAIPHGAVAA